MGDRIKIISGGQSGVDRAALDAAFRLGLSVGGWCPKDRRAEDGAIPDWYPLTETSSSEFHVRTQRNVETSSATLVITRGAPTGSARYAVEVAASMRRPLLIVDLLTMRDDASETVSAWLMSVKPRVLNVTGPRESNAPGISAETERLLVKALTRSGLHSNTREHRTSPPS